MIHALCLLLFFTSLLNISWSDQRTLWMASIVTTELGHWFALFSLLVGFYLFKKHRLHKSHGLLFVSVVFFLFPIGSNISNISSWQKKFSINLKASEPSLFSLKRTLIGTWFSKVQPENYIYSQKHNLSLDLYRASCNGPCPLIIAVHGGGWDSGDSQQLSHLNQYVVSQGISVAAINYRLVPRALWPAQKDDLTSAIDFLRANQSELNLDMKNYVLMGRSAGSQIAGVVAYTIKDPGLKGYIDLYGPTDLEFGYEIANDSDVIESKKLLENFLGGKLFEQIDNFRSASMLQFISSESVPTLILHGKIDPLCWYKHGERLKRRLEHNKVPVVDIIFSHATHGFDYFLSGASGQIASSAIISFSKSLFEVY